MAASPAAAGAGPAGAGPAGAGSSAVSGTKSTYATTVEHAAAVKPWTPEEPADPANKIFYGPPDRNKDVILGVLREHLPKPPAGGVTRVLELASGTGQHAEHVCSALPYVRWQPTDMSDELLRSTAARAAETAGCDPPLRVDCMDDPWQGVSDGAFDAVFNANMVHVAPVEVVDALFRGGSRALKPDGRLLLYGPFKVDGEPTTESNARFDKSLQERDARWGLRDISDLELTAGKYAMCLAEKLEVPSNNFVLVFDKATDES